MIGLVISCCILGYALGAIYFHWERVNNFFSDVKYRWRRAVWCTKRARQIQKENPTCSKDWIKNMVLYEWYDFGE